jgi:transcriptional regulator with XRE-family HTH domain
MEELRRIRDSQGWSQQKLADVSGVNKATINQIERGRRSPNIETLEKLADALRVELADFFPKVQAPLSFEEPERDVSAERRLLLILFRSWGHDLKQIHARFEHTLDNLPDDQLLEEMDEKERRIALAEGSARLESLGDWFYAVQESLVGEGVAELLHESLFAERPDSGPATDEVSEAARELRSVNVEIQRRLVPQAAGWVRRDKLVAQETAKLEEHLAELEQQPERGRVD